MSASCIDCGGPLSPEERTFSVLVCAACVRRAAGDPEERARQQEMSRRVRLAEIERLAAMVAAEEARV